MSVVSDDRALIATLLDFLQWVDVHEGTPPADRLTRDECLDLISVYLYGNGQTIKAKYR